MVRLNYASQDTFYFYAQPNFNKSISEHLPFDSLVLERNELGLNILYAPAWLAPEHMKLDYEILFFKATGISDDFIEVETNAAANRRAYMDRRSLQFTPWDQFLLQVHSVELKDDREQQVRIKPLDHASTLNKEYAVLKPLLVRDQWMKVELISEDYESLGEGWIQWNKDGEMLVIYNLLS